MGWNEGVLIVALVVTRVYGLGLDAIRAWIHERAADEDGRIVTQRWVVFLLLSSAGAAALLGMSSLLAAAGTGTFSAGVRVGLALWLSEVLVHGRSIAAFARQMRDGETITLEGALSQPVACWTSTVPSIPMGALIGSWIAR
jgi:hypothetical protein